MRNIFEDVGNRIGEKELILILLLTAIFLLVSFVGHTRFAMTEITDKWGTPHEIHVSFYGFPFEMIGILNPLGTMENYYISMTEIGLVQLLWGGLLLNAVLYFLLALTLVYSFKRLRG